MANTAVLDPFQTKKPERVGVPLGGRIGDMEYRGEASENLTPVPDRIQKDLQSIELNPDEAKPIFMASEGSIAGFNQPAQEKIDVISQAEDVAQKAWETPSVETNQALDEATSFLTNILHEAPSAVGGTVSDLKDLLAVDIFGAKKESKPEASKPLTPQELEIKANAQEARSHNARMEEATQLNAQFQEVHFMNDQQRELGGTITEQDMRGQGFMGYSIENVRGNRPLGTLIRIRRMEDMAKLRKQEEKTEAEAVKPVMGINEMFKGYERSGGGHWSTSVG